MIRKVVNRIPCRHGLITKKNITIPFEPSHWLSIKATLGHSSRDTDSRRNSIHYSCRRQLPSNGMFIGYYQYTK